jgi:hypothetical protein
MDDEAMAAETVFDLQGPDEPPPIAGSAGGEMNGVRSVSLLRIIKPLASHSIAAARY